MFADDQILLAKSEDLQQSVHKLKHIVTKYNMNISKTKAMALSGKRIPRVKIVIIR